MLEIHVKSMPGTFVLIEPILIGSPVAFSPVPKPHSPDFWMAPLAAPPPAAVVAAPPPAAVVAAPPPAVVAAPPPAVVADDDPESSPHAANRSAPVTSKTGSRRFMKFPSRSRRWLTSREKTTHSATVPPHLPLSGVAGRTVQRREALGQRCQSS